MLRARQAELDAWYVDYASGLRPADLDALVEFTFIGGNAGSMTRRDILLHVVNHCTYHRGHAADMLYTFGIVPPTTDLPVFATQGQAASAL